jgi:hypothetical protein
MRCAIPIWPGVIRNTTCAQKDVEMENLAGLMVIVWMA